MRIAYIAPFQGPTLVNRRPVVGNFSLGGRAKVQLIAELLQRNSHEVEVLSQGEVIVHQFKLYPGFCEPEPFHANIPVYYSSALPVKYLNGLWSGLSLLRIFKARHRASPFDAVMIYNLKPPQVACAEYAIQHLGLPVILESEDDQFMEAAKSSFTSKFYLSKAKRLLRSVSGCLAASPYLLAQAPEGVPKLLLPGVVGEAIVNATRQNQNSRRNWVVFSGTHYRTQGLEQLVTGWGMANLSGWQLHIAGHGEMTNRLHELARNNPSIVFHGVLDREANAQLLSMGKLAAVPYDVSQTRGFSFKTLECLAAGLHVITTPLEALEALEPELKVGITYMNDNKPETIAACLKKVIAEGRYEQTAQQATLEKYGPAAVSRSLDTFMKHVVGSRS